MSKESDVRKALMFYADPETYSGTEVFGGPLYEDCDDLVEIGAMARRALGLIQPEVRFDITGPPVPDDLQDAVRRAFRLPRGIVVIGAVANGDEINLTVGKKA